MIKPRDIVPAASAIRERSVTSAADTAAVITITGVPGQAVYLHRVQWSYDGTPTGGKLTVKNGSTGAILWEQAITAAGPGGQDPDEFATVNTDMIITLAAGGGGVTGRIAAVRAERVAQ